MRWLAIVMVCLLCLSPAGADDKAEKPVPRRRSPRAVAAAIVATTKANDQAVLQTLAEGTAPDPWLVVDELCASDAFDAAGAYVAAATSPRFLGLADYVKAQSKREDPTVARKTLAQAGASFRTRSSEAAKRVLASLASVDVPRAHVVGVRIHKLRAAAYRAAGSLMEAQASLVAAADIARPMGWRYETARSLDGAGRLAAALGEHKPALAHYAQALELMRALSERVGEAAVRTNMAAAHYALGDYAQARNAYERAKPVMHELRNPAAYAQLLQGLGLVYEHLYQFDDAAAAFDEQVEVYGKEAPPRLRATALINAGNAHLALARYPKALEAYGAGLDAARAASAAAERAGHASEKAAAEQLITNGLLSIAGAYEAIGSLVDAMSHARESLERMKAHGATAELAAALSNVGLVLHGMGDENDAHDMLTDAIRVAKEAKAEAFQADALSNLGRLHLEREAYDAAKEAFDQARAIQESLGDDRGAAKSTGSLGLILFKQGEPINGLKGLRTCELGARSARDPALEIWSLRAQAAIHISQARDGRAQGLALRALDKMEDLIGGLAEGEAASARSMFASVFGVGAFASTRLSEPAEVSLFLESGRAGALLEQLGGRHRIRWEDIPENLRHQEQMVMKQIDTAERKLNAYSRAHSDRSRRKLRKQLTVEVDRARARLQRLAGRIQREAKAQAANLCYPRAATMEEIQTHLEDGQTLVLYGICVDAVIALVLTNEGEHISNIGTVKRITEVCEALVLDDKYVENEHKALIQAAKTLLIGELDLPKSTKQLIISPEGLLCTVPFGALTDLPVSLTPSGTTHVLLKKEQGPRGEHVLGVGAPDYSGKADAARRVYWRGKTPAPLPHSRSEVMAVSDEHLLGPEANEEEIARRLRGGKRWRAIHFACHGFVDQKHPTMSCLALSRGPASDGFLTAAEVLRMDMPTDLAVLSACQTGRGRVVPGEGIVGLTRAFMYAGASRVLCSLWQVPDQPTAALMTKFYELWNPEEGEGLSASEALRGAQTYVRDYPDKDWSHPENWAAWVLWGLPN